MSLAGCQIIPIDVNFHLKIFLEIFDENSIQSKNYAGVNPPCLMPIRFKHILSKAIKKIFSLKTFGKKNGHDLENVLKIEVTSKNLEMIIIFLGSGTHPQLACNHCTRSKLQNSLKKSRKRTLQQRQPV